MSTPRSALGGAPAGVPPARSIEEIIRLAQTRLSAVLWDHAMGGAGTEATLRRNGEQLDRLVFRPRVLRGAGGKPTTRTSFLGVDLAAPVMLAPVGPLELYDPGGALASATAAHAVGTASFVSTTSSPALDIVATQSSGPLFFQLYVRGDRGWLRDTVQRVHEVGYRGLCVTIDAPVYGRRERDVRHDFVHTEHIELPNLRRDRQRSALPEELAHQSAVTWDDIDWLRGLTPLPLILKGIMCAEDARLAVEHGAVAVYLSNHGGRLLDHSQATIEVLPSVVAEVADRAEVVLDGGFWHGEDVAKALALGARAVLVGKLQCCALAAGGAPMLLRALELMQQELELTLPQLGVRSVSELHLGLLVSGAGCPCCR